MSNQDATRPTHEEEEDDPQLNEEDIVEVHEDDDDQPMDDDDDEDHAMDGQDDDEDNSKYDGEIVIGAPQPGEEEALAALDDNTLGATCTSALVRSYLEVRHMADFREQHFTVNQSLPSRSTPYSPTHLWQCLAVRTT